MAIKDNLGTNFGEKKGTSYIFLTDEEGFASLVRGTVVPTDATAGFSKGCLFVHSDGALGAVLYLNEGTNASCDFNVVESGAYGITGVTASTVLS